MWQHEVSDLDPTESSNDEQPSGDGAVVHGGTYVEPVDWRMETLSAAIGKDLARQFFWKAETDTIQTYEHRLTYRYVHLDCVTGQFCNQQRSPISTEQALAHALPPRPEPVPQLLLAPVIIEPNLLPFVRRLLLGGVREEDGPAILQASVSGSRREGVVARFFRFMRGRLSVEKRITEMIPRERKHFTESQELVRQNEVTLSRFTRRVA